MDLGLKGQKSRLGLELTVIQRGFELYECLMSLCLVVRYVLLTSLCKDSHAHNFSFLYFSLTFSFTSYSRVDLSRTET